MKFVAAFIAVLLSFHSNGIKSERVEAAPIPPEVTSSTEKLTVPTTTAAAGQDSLDNISIQDLLLSGIEANEKIQKKIIEGIKTFPNNFQSYRNPIVLTTAGYVFPKSQLEYTSEEGHVIFYNVTVSHLYDNSHYTEQPTSSFSLSCDSSTEAKIRVGLPTNIHISANFSVTHSHTGAVNEGEIEITIRNGTILKLEGVITSQDNEVTEISFTDLKFNVKFNIASIPQSPVYDKLYTFFNEVQSSLSQFFHKQLDERMEERGLSILSDCSKTRFTEPQVKKINLPYYNTYINNLYVIPKAKLETWKGITLSVGPTLISGFNFNSTEFSISKEINEHSPSYFKWKMSSRIITGKLAGKFEWKYNLNSGNANEDNSSIVFSFSINNILFEDNYLYRPNYDGLQHNMNVYLGEMKIKPSAESSDFENVYEVKFAKFVLSEYLKSAIAESLKTPLSQKIDYSQRRLVETFFED